MPKQKKWKNANELQRNQKAFRNNFRKQLKQKIKIVSKMIWKWNERMLLMNCKTKKNFL